MDKQYECAFCGMKFFSVLMLRVHLQDCEKGTVQGLLKELTKKRMRIKELEARIAELEGDTNVS